MLIFQSVTYSVNPVQVNGASLIQIVITEVIAVWSDTPAKKWSDIQGKTWQNINLKYF